MALKKLTTHRKKGHTAAETKKKLVEAGLELFARFSFDGVSTRTLAQHAQVNLAAIQYYFGGKEGLYLAVSRNIVETLKTWTQPLIQRIEDRLSSGHPDKNECFTLLCELLDHIIERALGTQESKQWMGIFMREQLDPTQAFDILYDGVLGPFHQAMCGLIAGILNLRRNDEETKLRAYAVAGQVFIFHIARAEIRRSMAWKDYHQGELEMIRQVILEQVRSLLGVPHDALDAYFRSAAP